tara:strand:+ start:2168 stop:3481 length:1314 start_codon:yes stop_codon:yes gene_type:complete
MKTCLLFFTIIAGLISQIQAQTENFQIAEELGKQAAEFLQKSEFEKLHALFSEDMGATLSSKQMERSFSGLLKQFGTLNKIEELQVKETAEGNYYQQAVSFDKGKFFLTFTLNQKESFTSFMLKPYQPNYKWTPPSYAKGKYEYSQEKVTVGDSLALNGKMTISNGMNEIVVVFVHGSGPNDMDESLGPNKLFNDLAFGLAANGIASIRYNKRTYDYPSQMARQANSLTIQQVVIDDAVNAVRLARENGAKKVILIGHSLGGYCAPLIAELTQPDAVITLAGNVSPLEDLLVPQYEYIKNNDTSKQINDLQMAMIRTQVKRIQDNEYDAETAPPLLPLGLPASFWLSLKDYEPQKLARKQAFPYLILNGERDYQMTPKEAKKWKNGSKNKHSKTIIYLKLNHLFFEGEGICLPSEYEKEGHFSERTLNDIINWINEI